MNKKLLLLALPALMAMSSCTYLASGTVQKGNFFKEDASAKVDVFGGEEEAVPLRKNEPFRSAAADLAEPIIGVQYRAAYEKENKSYIAVRFIAAIKSLDVNAEWTRSVYDANGARVGAEASYETTQAYTSLSGMGETVYPSKFGAEYNYFVAYTLYDIPFEEKDDYYIVASVELSDTEGSLSSVNSLEMAARIGGDVAVKFDNNKEGFFLAGKINGASSTVDPENSIKGGNAAAFASFLSSGDSFVVVEKEANLFRVWDGSCLQDGDSNAANVDRMIKINTSCRFAIYLNTTDQLYHTAYTGYPDEWDYHVRGIATTGSWDSIDENNDSFRLHADPTNKGFIRVHLKTGEFKLTHRSDWDYAKGYDDGVFNAPGSALDGVHIGGQSGGNFNCLTAGTYDIYLNDSWKVHFVYVSNL